MLSHFPFRDECIFSCSFSVTAPAVDFESTGFSAGRMVKKDGSVSPECHVNDYLCSVRVVTDADEEVLEHNQKLCVWYDKHQQNERSNSDTIRHFRNLCFPKNPANPGSIEDTPANRRAVDAIVEWLQNNFRN